MTVLTKYKQWTISGPLTWPPSAGRIPGWNEYVAPFWEKSLFWHQLWIANDRSRSGIIADIMRRTRAQYHYAIRSVNKNRDDIVNERFATAMITNNDRDF
jgi:hypothetical protein